VPRASASRSLRPSRRSRPWRPSRSHLAIGALLAVVLVADLLLLARQGVQIGGDTPRYVDGGDALVHGGSLTDRQKLYLAYVAAVGLAQAVGVGLTGVVVAQIVVGVAATLAAFSLARRLAGDAAGLIAAAVFGLNPEIVRWNLYVLPDAPYTGWLVIAVWAVERAARTRRGAAWAALALVALAGLRANGWVPAAIGAGYVVLHRVASMRARAAAIAAIVVVVAGLTAALPARTGASQTLLPGTLLREGQVIWDYQPSFLSVPRDPSVTDDNWPGFVEYTARHPLAAARVFAARVWVEARQTRPYYSTSHNAVTLAFVVVLYGGALAGFVTGRDQRLIRLIGLIVLAHLAMIAVTSADYDGRYGRHVFGLLAVVCGYGLARTLAPAAARLGRAGAAGDSPARAGARR
jgi:hypothetical protein